MPLPSGTPLGAYVVLSALGSGGMGEVYKARDSRLNRIVALKVLPEALRSDLSALARFQKEARVLAGLNHPGIVAIFDVGQVDGVPFLVTEFLEGRTLASHLERGSVPRDQALDWIRQISHALAAAHAKGIVHRDLKPANVMIGKDGRARLLDFGLAREIRMDLSNSTGTMQGAILGTVGYMAPEQVRGETADARSDLFALGVMLLEMLTGTKAFNGDSSVEVLHAILRSDPLTDREVSGGLKPLIAHLLAKEPDARFQSAIDLLFALEQLPPERPAAVTGRKWVGSALISLTVTVAFVAGFMFWNRGGRVAPLPVYSVVTQLPAAIRSARISRDGQIIAFSAEDKEGRLRVNILRSGRPYPDTTEQVGTLLAVARDGECILSMDHAPLSPGVSIGGPLLRWAGPGTSPVMLAKEGGDADFDPGQRQLALIRTPQNAYMGKEDCLLESPPGNVLFRSNRWLRSPRFNPEGNRIAFLQNTHGDGWSAQIVIVDLLGRECWRSPTILAAAGLGWAPGGGFLFTHRVPTGSACVAHITQTGRVRDLLRTPADSHFLDVDARGRALVYLENPMVRRVYREDRGTWTPVPLPFQPGGLSSSMDGRVLSFTVREISGRPGAYIFEMATGATKRLATGVHVVGISPDGGWVCLSDETNPFGPDPRMRLVPIAGGPEVPLRTEGMGVGRPITILSDGRAIVASLIPGKKPSYKLISASHEPEDLNSPPSETSLLFSPGPNQWIAANAQVVYRSSSVHGPWEAIQSAKGKWPLGWDPVTGDLILTDRGKVPSFAMYSDWEAKAQNLPRWRLTPKSGRIVGMPPLPTLKPQALADLVFAGMGCCLPGKAVHLDFPSSGNLYLVEGLLPAR